MTFGQPRRSQESRGIRDFTPALFCIVLMESVGYQTHEGFMKDRSARNGRSG